MTELEEVLRQEREVAADKAIDALSRYKFWMFGYWAAVWVGLNHHLRQIGAGEPNPFAEIVKTASLLRVKRSKRGAA